MRRVAAAALGACATPGHGADASATRRSRRLEVMWIVVVGSLGASHRGAVVLRAGRYCGSRRRSALLAPQKCVNDLRVCGRENVGEARHACGHELSQKDDAIERCLGFRVSCGRAADRHPMRRSGRKFSRSRATTPHARQFRRVVEMPSLRGRRLGAHSPGSISSRETM